MNGQGTVNGEPWTEISGSRTFSWTGLPDATRAADWLFNAHNSQI